MPFVVMMMLQCVMIVYRRGRRTSSVCRFMDTRQAQKFINAVQDSNLKAIRRRLAKKKCDIDGLYRFESSMEKMSALHYAAKEGLVEALRELLDGGCDPNVTTQFDIVTPLHFACLHPDPTLAMEMATYLLQWGVDPDARDHCQRTPLIIACELGNLELVLLLLEWQADINHQCLKEDYPLGIRWVREHMLLLPNKWVEEVCDPYKGNNALIQACREHHLIIVQELINRGCDINSRNASGNTALHVACKSQSRHLFMDQLIRPAAVGHPEIVQLLIDKQAELDPLNKHGDTPLRRVISCMPEVNRQEIETEAKLTAFFDAFHIIELLVQAGADATLLDGNGDSVLHTLFQVRVKCASMFDPVLEERFITVARTVIMAGCPVTQRDRHIVDKVMSPYLADMLNWKLNQPYKLKQAVRLQIRNVLSKPIAQYVGCLELPASLQKYLTLEILD